MGLSLEQKQALLKKAKEDLQDLLDEERRLEMGVEELKGLKQEAEWKRQHKNAKRYVADQRTFIKQLEDDLAAPAATGGKRKSKKSKKPKRSRRGKKQIKKTKKYKKRSNKKRSNKK